MKIKYFEGDLRLSSEYLGYENTDLDIGDIIDVLDIGDIIDVDDLNSGYEVVTDRYKITGFETSDDGGMVAILSFIE